MAAEQDNMRLALVWFDNPTKSMRYWSWVPCSMACGSRMGSTAKVWAGWNGHWSDRVPPQRGPRAGPCGGGDAGGQPR